MIFPTTSLTTLLGFASVAIAAPHLHSRYERSLAVRQSGDVAQGIHWTPKRQSRNNNRNGNFDVVQDITITQFSNTVIQDQQRNSDVQLVQLIQERIIVVDNTRQLRDNVRRNTFKNRRNNNNDNVNVVIVVVQEVIDQRIDGNENKRYLARKLQSNRNAQEQILIVISESNQYTISRDDQATRVQELLAESTGNAEQKYADYDPNAELSKVENNSNDFIEEILLPAGASAPRWSNAEESADPSIILDPNTDALVFVVFGNEQDSRNNKNDNNRNDNNNDRNNRDRNNKNNNDNNAIIIAIDV